MKCTKLILALIVCVQFSCTDTEISPNRRLNHTQSEESEESEESDFDVVTTQLLHMTSYLTTRAIIENEEARNYFREIMISSETDHFLLSEILEPNLTDENPFEEEFYRQFQKYNYEIIIDSTIVDEETTYRVVPPEQSMEPDEDLAAFLCPNPNLPQNSAITSPYINYKSLLVEENNIDIAFPNIEVLGASVSLEEHVSMMRTTWHPLDNSTSNIGLELYEEGGECLCIDKSTVEEPVFLILLRPSNTNGFNYGNIDFTEFLSH